MVIEEPPEPKIITADWEKVDRAIHEIHKILYDEKLTLLEIDMIVYTIWTNTQKEKIVQLALQDVKKALDTPVKTIEKPKNPPGVG